MVEIKQMLAPVIANGARSGLQLNKLIGVTIHNTDNWDVGANAIRHGMLLQGGGSHTQTSWHYAVDDKQAVQSIPDNEVAWHAADGTTPNGGNMCAIAIEICLNQDGDLAKATDNGAELAAHLLKKHGLPATALYQHHDWSGKNCPSQIRAGKPYDWATFKSKVAAYYGGETPRPEEPAKPSTNSDRETGAAFTCTGLWTQANGGTWYPAGSLLYGKGDYTIGKVHSGSEHPYEALYNGQVIGFANDKCIDDEPSLPGSKTEVKPAPTPVQPSGPKYGVGTKVTFTGLWTASNGGAWYPRNSLLVKQGIITKVVPGADHPYLISGDVGWANDRCIDEEPTVYR